MSLLLFFKQFPAGIEVDAGAYVLTGQDVALRFDRKILLDAGSYVITGIDVEIIISLSPAGYGRFALVGSTAMQTFGFKMIQNFIMVAGDTKTLVVTVEDAEGTAVSITGATIKWRCARSYGKTASITKATGGSGIAITDGAGGEFTVTLNASDTVSLVGNFYHEAEITF